MFFAVSLGYIVSLIMIFAGRLFRNRFAWALSLVPFSLFVFFYSKLPDVSAGKILRYSYNWVPAAGINLNFTLDGLSMLFSLMITGIGTLVYLYSSSYLHKKDFPDRFFAYLSMFMASMLGLVLSDNIFCLFIFWELTSISSFFLIGFDNTNKDSRKSALTALTITGGGGFLLLCGLILMNKISGTASIGDMVAYRELLHNNFLFPWVLIFVLAGAFTKSAQFPFHFWLPAAMKAPTPVSTYLHSATMVKAGIYLVLRFTPVLGEHPYWNNPIAIAGGITMLFGAFHSVFRTDLKSILAYSTISALGLIMFLIGLGTEAALMAAAVFILVHALYKAALFLITGILDHETGTRDILELGGLRKNLWPVALAGLLAAVSSAGIPLSFGFIGKELIYASTLASNNFPIILTSAVVITNIFLLAAGFIAGVNPFKGTLPLHFKDVHLPHFTMWIPPLLLSIAGILFGLFPHIIGSSLIDAMMLAINPQAKPEHLAIWHGFNIVLLLSGITLLLGLILYFVYKPRTATETIIYPIRNLTAERLFGAVVDSFRWFSKKYTAILQNGYLRVYVLTILSFLLVLVGYSLSKFATFPIHAALVNDITIYEVAVVLMMFVSIMLTVFSRSRLLAVASLGVVGYCICLIFVFYSAPDVAMTQFTIDTLTVVLFVLVLYSLPAYLEFSNIISKTRDAVVAIALGSTVTIIILEVMSIPPNRETSLFYATNAYKLAKGKNIVNVILVDFRGIDTLVEISVLTIAALGVFSLLKLKDPSLNGR